MNYKKLVVKILVTFVEAALAQLAVTGWNVSNKTAIAGVVGSALSVVWNTTVYPALQNWLSK